MEYNYEEAKDKYRDPVFRLLKQGVSTKTIAFSLSLPEIIVEELANEYYVELLLEAKKKGKPEIMGGFLSRNYNQDFFLEKDYVQLTNDAKELFELCNGKEPTEEEIKVEAKKGVARLEEYLKEV